MMSAYIELRFGIKWWVKPALVILAIIGLCNTRLADFVVNHGMYLIEGGAS